MDPCGRYGNFMLSRIGIIAPLLLLVDDFGQIRDTVKSTVTATRIEYEKHLSKLFSWAGDDSMDPHGRKKKNGLSFCQIGYTTIYICPYKFEYQ